MLHQNVAQLVGLFQASQAYPLFDRHDYALGIIEVDLHGSSATQLEVALPPVAQAAVVPHHCAVVVNSSLEQRAVSEHPWCMYVQACHRFLVVDLIKQLQVGWRIAAG